MCPRYTWSTRRIKGQRSIMHKYEGLKDLVKEEHFKMEGLHLPPDLLKPGDLIVKVNLKDAYLQVPIYPESQTIIHFSLFTGNRNFTESPIYLPFGLLSAHGHARVFTKLNIGFIRQVGRHYIQHQIISKIYKLLNV